MTKRAVKEKINSVLEQDISVANEQTSVLHPATITLKQTVSNSGAKSNQIQTLKGLGLNKIGRISTLINTQSVQGMIKKVAHLIEVIKK